MQFPVRIRRDSLREDTVAGVVLGVQSVPDGLAIGLLAGVNPIAGLNAYLVGTMVGALATSSVFMAIQGTGAMAMIVSDVEAVHASADPARALFTLSVLTGVVMLGAGLLRLGSILRFVSHSVMVGFINAVGVNIVLGQLADFTGYAAEGANRITRAIDTLLHPGAYHLQTFAIGVATIALIVVLERTRLKALGLIVAVVVTSAIPLVLGWVDVATLSDIGVIPSSLPRPELPDLALVPVLLVPALSLAFVGLVQGASISANYPNPDGSYPDASQDFVGQGVANVAAGVFQGMPVGGSISASALNKAAGARSRQALVIAGVVMAVVIVAFGGLIANIAMPALAGLLILIGYPHDQARRPLVGLADGPRAEDRPHGDLRADDAHPAPVRGPCRSGPVGRPPRGPPGEPNHRQATADRRRWERRRRRSASRAPRPRGRRPPAIRQSVLRGGADVRVRAAEPDRRLARFGRDRPPARSQRPRDHLHGRAVPICGQSERCRQQAHAGVHERADR